MYLIAMKSMTVRPFLDTNVLLYSLDLQTGTSRNLRAEKAEQILSLGGVLSVQVLNEFADVASRKMKLSWEKIAGFLQIFELLCGRAVPLTAETHEKALGISKRYGYRIYDSAILAAAIEAGCTTLLTEDMQHGQVVEGVRIENPFL
jgi:predicted nucleic acid-binding protein